MGQLGRKLGQSLRSPICESVLDDNVLPSIKPISFSPWRNAATMLAESVGLRWLRYPITGIAGCASTVSDMAGRVPSREEHAVGGTTERETHRGYWPRPAQAARQLTVSR
jgi:hypothetical protein